MQSINFAAPYTTPIHAVHNGRPVRILATGDQEGSSPVFQCVDETGKAQWVSQDQVTITDPNALPASQTALRNASNALSGNGTGSSGSQGRQPVGSSR